nr:hypothetical protein [Bradyrhizobium elkanii]
MEDYRPLADSDENRNVGDRLSLRRPRQALTLALGKLALDALARGQRGIKPGVNVDVKIQTYLMNNVFPDIIELIKLGLAKACRQSECGHAPEPASDRDGNSRPDPKRRCLIKKLPLRSVSGSDARRSTAREQIPPGPGTKDHGVELLVAELKVPAGPRSRVGRDQQRRFAIQTQISEALEAKFLRHPSCDPLERSCIVSCLDCVNKLLKCGLHRTHSMWTVVKKPRTVLSEISGALAMCLWACRSTTGDVR